MPHDILFFVITRGLFFFLFGVGHDYVRTRFERAFYTVVFVIFPYDTACHWQHLRGGNLATSTIARDVSSRNSPHTHSFPPV
jgi:hypothetical protein